MGTLKQVSFYSPYCDKYHSIERNFERRHEFPNFQRMIEKLYYIDEYLRISFIKKKKRNVFFISNNADDKKRKKTLD